MVVANGFSGGSRSFAKIGVFVPCVGAKVGLKFASVLAPEVRSCVDCLGNDLRP